MAKGFKIEFPTTMRQAEEKIQCIHVYTSRGHKRVYVPISDVNGFVNCLLFLGFKNENIPS